MAGTATRRCRVIVALGLWFVAVPPLSSAAQLAIPVARVLGEDIRCSDFGADNPNNLVNPNNPDACAPSLLRHIRARVEQDFVQRRGLAATAAEVAALERYNREFEQQDRNQRSRKLIELENRLARAETDSSERPRLEAFRDILLRLARFEADVDAGIEQREPIPLDTLRGWIETTKLNSVLYTKYGGSVGVAASGPYAHGARAALITDYLERGAVVLFDRQIAQRLRAALSLGPPIVHPEGPPDFTPFWERPIPPSYLAH